MMARRIQIQCTTCLSVDGAQDQPHAVEVSTYRTRTLEVPVQVREQFYSLVESRVLNENGKRFGRQRHATTTSMRRVVSLR